VRRSGGLIKALGIAAIIVLFLVSTIVFTPAFQSQPLTDQVTGLVGLFFNFYLLVAAAVVLGWFVYKYFIWPRLRYNKLLRIRAARRVEKVQ
jgi:uncharacterized membrane protein